MKDVIQKIVREEYGYTPVKGDIKIGPEVDTDQGKARKVMVGSIEMLIKFDIAGTIVG